jgi:hypothetical protein
MAWIRIAVRIHKNWFWQELIASWNEQLCFLQTSPHLYCMRGITDESTEPHFYEASYDKKRYKKTDSR